MAKETQTKPKSLMNFDLKKIGNQSAQGGLGVLGFSLGHVLFNNAVPSSLRTGMKGFFASLAMFIIGGFIAYNSTKEYVKSSAMGFQLYSGVKALNTITNTAPAVSGLGFALPEGIRAFGQKVLPNLGEAPISSNDFQIFGPGTEIPAEEATYQILGDNPSELVLEDNPITGFDGGVTVDGLGVVEIS
jgi:hypothetical protein